MLETFVNSFKETGAQICLQDLNIDYLGAMMQLLFIRNHEIFVNMLFLRFSLA
jgi:hypothetical protein